MSEEPPSPRYFRFNWPLIYFLGACGLFALVAGLNSALHPPPLPDSAAAALRAQEDAEIAAYARQRAIEDKAADDRDATYCKLAVVCAHFKDARQACATAGNFATCVSVKMEPDSDKTVFCSNDGSIAAFVQPKIMPNPVRCAALDPVGAAKNLFHF